VLDGGDQLGAIAHGLLMVASRIEELAVYLARLA
jgi:hypothetical protein